MEPYVKEKFAEEVIKASVKIAIDILKSVGNKVKDKVAISKAMTMYVESYISRHGTIKVLGMSKPTPLYGLYTDLQIIDSNKRKRYETLEQLEDLYRESGKREIGYSSPGARRDAIEMANTEQYLNVLGAPGSGKTTFLRRIGLEAMLPKRSWSLPVDFDSEYLSKYEYDTLPVYLELRRFRTEKVDMVNLIQREFSVFGFPDANSFVLSALKKGKLLLLFDGLDEVPKDKLDDVIDHIKDFTDKYRKNRFITSCRVAFYRTYFSRYTDVEVAEFSNPQIKIFVKNWFSSGDYLEAITAETFLRELFSTNQSSTLELARTPLLLTFLCLVFDESQRLPSNRASLYRRALMILLEKWSAEKRVHNDPIYKEFHPDLEIEMLANISAQAFEAEQIFFSEEELLALITGYLQGSLGEPKSVNSRKALEAIEIQQGLIVQRAEGVYSFSHLTIQEYLTAYYFHAPGRIKKMSSNHLYDNRWREIFLLMSGMPQSDATLDAIFQANQDFASKNKYLRVLLKWVKDEMNHVEDLQKSFCRRMFAFCLPLRFMMYTKSGSLVEKYVTDADELIFNLGSHLGSLRWKRYPNRRELFELIDSINVFQIFNFDEKTLRRKIITVSERTNYALTKRGMSLYLESIGLKKELRELSPSSSVPLVKYLYGCLMIFQCKDAALRISRENWERILNQLIKPVS